MIVIDNFINSYNELREFADTCEFLDVRNPVDDVVYPLICDEIPEPIKTELLGELTKVKGSQPTNVTMFMRMSPNGVHCPHPIHHDLSMGSLSMMLYLNDHPDGGTAFVRHIDSGVTYAPGREEFVDILKADQSNPDAWVRYDRVQMKQNRAVIFDSGLMHAAEPMGGFGSTQEGARIVLTCFFS